MHVLLHAELIGTIVNEFMTNVVLLVLFVIMFAVTWYNLMALLDAVQKGIQSLMAWLSATFLFVLMVSVLLLANLVISILV